MVFPHKNFLLQNSTARQLYEEYAQPMPIIDYHNHLPPGEIANDHNFENLTQIWLYGDHYKWRAMRINGVSEAYCTGEKSDWEKFEKWAETVPYTLRNPLFHWTQLELNRYFGIEKTLSPSTAREIYEECSAKLRTKEYSVKNLLKKMNVQVLCTTDDPLDNLEHHQKLKNDGFEIKVIPAFRPDKAMQVEDPSAFNEYLKNIERAAGVCISSFDEYLVALKGRHDYFAKMGCSVSDHGLEHLYAEDFSDNEVRSLFLKLRDGKNLNIDEVRKMKSALLFQFAIWDWEKGWVQQFHLGARRNNNRRMLNKLGTDTGWDSIGDFSQGESLAKFLDRLDNHNQLAKTIIYNINPADNALMATMIGNFCDGSTPGKLQWGSAWWFLDQKEGMTRQINTLSNMGLLSRFVGMLTDSRSFLSFPRHEYFRRILCNIFGEEMEKGELPDDVPWVGKLIQDICYNNAKSYFGW
jgi:glucuronate isomerase